MQISSKFLFRTAIVLLGVMMAITVFVGINSSQRADALSGPPGEWDTVKGAIYSYLTGQFQPGNQGEAGYVMTPADLKSRLDSNGDMTVLGEGDDAGLAPVLVDTYNAQADFIPGTSVRGLWNTTSLQAGTVTQIKDEVNQHDAAGFTTAVVAYCVTGHTEAPVSGGYGFVAQAGGLGGSTPPNVKALKWGRQGWTNGTKTYANTGAMGSPGTVSTYSLATNPTPCNGVTPDSELVRCTAEWALSASGGNVGNGVDPTVPVGGGAPSLGSVQPVDIRYTSPATTINNTASGPATIQIPINDLFNTGTTGLDPLGAKKIFFGATQHVAGQAAMAAEMLGYDSGFLKWGLPNWNKNEQEQWAPSGPTYTLTTAPEDETAPTQSLVGAVTVTATTATITRDASESATMKVEYGTTQGVYTGMAKDTILKKLGKSLTLTNLSPNTTYYYRLTSYDGMANPSTPIEGSFYTGDNTLPATTDDAPAGWRNGPVTVNLACTDPAGSNGFPATGCASTSYEVDGAATQTNNVMPTTSVAVSGDGQHPITYRSADNNSNVETPAKTATVKIDTTAPTVTYAGPTGTVGTSTVHITGTASDPGAPATGSGVASASVTLVSSSLNGGAPTTYNNCNVTGGIVDCTVSNLANGTYIATINATDGAQPGNTGTTNEPEAARTFEVYFTCEQGDPVLSSSFGNVRYGSVMDYVKRFVSVDLTVTNTGTTTAYNAKVTGASATNKVSFAGAAPGGDIAPGGSKTITLKYKLPLNRPSSFDTIVHMDAEDGCGTVYMHHAPGTVNVPLLP